MSNRVLKLAVYNVIDAAFYSVQKLQVEAVLQSNAFNLKKLTKTDDSLLLGEFFTTSCSCLETKT